MVDVHPGAEVLPVQVGGAEEVMVGEENRIGVLQRGIEGRRTIDPAGSLTGLDAEGGVLETERRGGIQPRHFIVDRCACYFEAGGTFLGADEMLIRRTAERALLRIRVDHVEATDQTNMLFLFHGCLRGRKRLRPMSSRHVENG